jgi:hypothetical protein
MLLACRSVFSIDDPTNDTGFRIGWVEKLNMYTAQKVSKFLRGML